MNTIDWPLLIRRIKMGKLTPFISTLVTSEHLFGSKDIVKVWAKKLGYPLADRDNLTRVAQFLSATSRDALAAKEEYLEFLKQSLLDSARQQQLADQGAFLGTLEEELFNLIFSEVTARLGYLNFENEPEHPLRILAELPLPIYLTTSYYRFMEAALKAAGKEPQTEICRWHGDLGDVPSIFEKDPNFQPSVETPLVYHLHGLDAYPASIVLTEDDYLDFLVKVSQDTEVIPRRVGQALADSSLLLLGYTLQGWDFRVLFRGLIKAKSASRRLLSLSIQLMPSTEEGVTNVEDAQNYLQKYFDKSNFDIYWGDVPSFTQELWKQWER